jgi:hypothetical protein
MDTTSNKEFYDLLNSATKTESFSLTLTDGKEYTFKQLSTSQLKDLIKTVVDSPLTQAVFNNTISRIMRESLVTEGIDASLFNVVDRLLFTLETRIQSISPKITLSKENLTEEIDLQKVKQKLTENLKSNSVLFVDDSNISNQVELTFGVPLIKTETQLNDELYKDVDLNVENQEELRKILGETFINELAKSIKVVKVQDKELDLSTVTFKSRLKTVESLPASLISNVISYIENYIKILDDSLLVKEDLSVPIDGSLFSLR